MTAIDRDAGRNGQVRYSLIGGNQGMFGIDPNNGQIRLRAPLQKSDESREILLVVRAEDLGN